MSNNGITHGSVVWTQDGVQLGSIRQIFVSPDGQAARLVLDSGPIIPSGLVQSTGADGVHLSIDSATARNTTWEPIPDDFREMQSFGVVGTGEVIRVPRYEEQLGVDKSWVQTGAIRVTKSVVEEPQTFSVDVSHEVYDMERVPVNRPWQPGEGQRVEGDTIIIPIVGEQIEVVRHRVVTEELRLTRRTVTQQQQVTETVRREVVEVSGPVNQRQTEAQ